MDKKVRIKIELTPVETVELTKLLHNTRRIINYNRKEHDLNILINNSTTKEYWNGGHNFEEDHQVNDKIISLVTSKDAVNSLIGINLLLQALHSLSKTNIMNIINMFIDSNNSDLSYSDDKYPIWIFMDTPGVPTALCLFRCVSFVVKYRARKNGTWSSPYIVYKNSIYRMHSFKFIIIDV